METISRNHVDVQQKYYILRVCVCTLSYPVCGAHAPYFNLWLSRLYSFLPHYLISGKINPYHANVENMASC